MFPSRGLNDKVEQTKSRKDTLLLRWDVGGVRVRDLSALRRRVKRQQPGGEWTPGTGAQLRRGDRALERSVKWGPGCGRHLGAAMFTLQTLQWWHDMETWWLQQIHADKWQCFNNIPHSSSCCCCIGSDISGVLSDIAHCNRVWRVITDWSHSRNWREKWTLSRRPRIKALDLIIHIKSDFR